MAKVKGTEAEANTIDYEAAVAEGKRILAAEESGRMRLGELAAQIETQYGKNKLAQFANDLRIAFCTVERARSVWNAWAEIPAARPESYSVARELQSVAKDDREHAKKIIADNPDLTSRRARKLAREWKQKNEPKKDGDHQNMERWFKDLVDRASKAIQDDLTKMDPYIRQILRKVVEPKLIPTVREGGQTWVRLADQLENLSRDDDAA